MNVNKGPQTCRGSDQCFYRECRKNGHTRKNKKKATEAAAVLQQS
jgi:hypothetical protein